MKQLNERHTWFNLDKNNEGCILRYTTKDGSMIYNRYVEIILENNPNNKVVLHRYGVIVFKEPLTSIGYDSFLNCTGLTSVTIPNSVTRIGNCAFFGCSSLTSITIPNSVTSIGEYAFYGCSGLTSVTIGSGVTSIGYGAISYCSSLPSITIPNNVTRIEMDVFSGCNGLTSVTIPNSVTRIGNAFYGCSSLTDITYKGTTEEFKKIKKEIKVFFNKDVNIHCTDGDITV